MLWILLFLAACCGAGYALGAMIDRRPLGAIVGLLFGPMGVLAMVIGVCAAPSRGYPVIRQ